MCYKQRTEDTKYFRQIIKHAMQENCIYYNSVNSDKDEFYCATIYANEFSDENFDFFDIYFYSNGQIDYTIPVYLGGEKLNVDFKVYRTIARRLAEHQIMQKMVDNI